jgi:hypothetical protein
MKNLELSFEYLYSKDNLKWVKIKSEQVGTIYLFLNLFESNIQVQNIIENKYVNTIEAIPTRLHIYV